MHCRLLGVACFVLCAAVLLAGCGSPVGMARFAGSTGSYDQMLQKCRRALEEAPDRPEAQLCVADAQYALADYDDARRYYRKYLSTRPDENDVRLKLVHIQLLERDHRDAMRHLAKVLKAEPDSARAHYYLGVAQSQAGQCRASKASLQKAAELSPGDRFLESLLVSSDLDACQEASARGVSSRRTASTRKSAPSRASQSRPRPSQAPESAPTDGDNQSASLGKLPLDRWSGDHRSAAPQERSGEEAAPAPTQARD